jgi:hypothetical protein
VSPFELVASLSADDTAIVIAVVGARLLIPLFIPRFPLIIVVALILDAADQTIFQEFTELNTGEDGPYQGYDKALDIYYLTIAYLSTMRNWTSDAAFRISQFLFFYRLVGVTLFELVHERILLLIFPNTFEYFFIAYELWRLRWDPAKRSARFWLLIAAGIWIFIKLPQEYWIHIAQLDVTDLIAETTWFGPLLVVAALVLLAVLLLVVRPRLPQPDWGWKLEADPLPAAIDEAHERAAFQAAHRKVFDSTTVEKIFLIGLISVIYGNVLPGVDASSLQLFIGIAVYAVINSAIGVWSARRGQSWDSATVSFAVVFATNVVLVFVADLLLGRGRGDLALSDTLFFIFLFSILTMLYDRYHPINDYRVTRLPKGADS